MLFRVASNLWCRVKSGPFGASPGPLGGDVARVHLVYLGLLRYRQTQRGREQNSRGYSLNFLEASNKDDLECQTNERCGVSVRVDCVSKFTSWLTSVDGGVIKKW